MVAATQKRKMICKPEESSQYAGLSLSLFLNPFSCICRGDQIFKAGNYGGS